MTIHIEYSPALKAWRAIQYRNKEMPVMSHYGNIIGTYFHRVKTFIACGATRQETLDKAIERTFHQPVRA